LSGLCSRTGFTLFEVVLAVGIFLGAIAVVAQIIDTGSRAARQAELQSAAVLRCESQMNEIVSGAVALASEEAVAFTDDPQWSWSLTLLEGPHADVLALEVLVVHTRRDGRVDAQFALRRLMRNPDLFLNAAAAAAEASETTESTQ
jgi:general secretion pathway protein I